MTFIELKEAILDASEAYEICPQYQDILNSTTYQELITAGISMFKYGWRTGIMTTTLLDEFTGTILEDNGIFYNKAGAQSLAVPMPYPFMDGVEVFVIGGTPSFTFGTTTRNKINIWSSDCTITAQNSAYVKVSTYNSELQMNVQDDAVVEANFRNPNGDVVQANVYGNATTSIFLEAYTTLNLFVADDSFTKINAYSRTVANLDVDESDVRVEARAYQNSTINYSVGV
jgi:hypothetical protein